MKPPLYATCCDCDGIRPVRTRHDQTRYKRCKRCAGRRNAARTDHAASGRLGGLASGRRRRAALMAKLKSLTPLQAYRVGRTEGWHAGARAALRRAA